MTTCQEVISEVSARLNAAPDLIKKIGGPCQFDISDEGGGQWYLDCSKPVVTAEPGAIENALVTLSMKAPEFIKLVTGQLNAQVAFLQGKLKVKGNINAALELQHVLRT